MRPFVRLSSLALPLLLLAVPAGAQYVAHRPSRDEGTLSVPRPATTLAVLAIRYGGDLQLSQHQLDVIDSVRVRQDSADAPWRRTLDSLRNGPRPVNPLDLSQEQREMLARNRATVARALAAMRQVDSTARTRIMAVLTPDQQSKANLLENSAQRLAREQPDRPADDYRYGERRGHHLDHSLGS